jgi:DNA topoisomerase I
MITGIRREKKGKSVIYTDKGTPVTDKNIIAWIESLVIPPAWSNVRIARSQRSKILAQGRDQAGRLQSIYHPKFRERQEKLKFDRILRFAEQLPALRRQLNKDLARRRLGKEKVLACIVRLIDEAYFRVGNERYAKENQSYGITTLRGKHTDVTGDTVTFDFIGKSGKAHVKQISDPQIARIIKQLDELPGYEIFRYQDAKGVMHDLSSADVNAYIKTHMGEEFTAKDFRTWGGTLIATTELLASQQTDNPKERTKIVTRVVKEAAERLGNTPAVARSSYIDPRIIDAYIDGTQVTKVRHAMESMRPKKYLSRDEQCVLRLLESSR